MTGHRTAERNTSRPNFSFTPDDQIIAMYHFGSAAEAEDRGNVSGCPAADLFCVVGVISAQAAGDFSAIGPADDYRVAAGEDAVNANYASRQ